MAVVRWWCRPAVALALGVSISACAPATPPAVTRLVSVSEAGVQGNGSSNKPSVSADGNHVAYESYASNLVVDDDNDSFDVFVWDRRTRSTRLVSRSLNGTSGSGISREASISGNGRYVAYESYAPDLVPGDTNGTWDIFVWDAVTGTNERVSVASDGGESNSSSSEPSISDDGRFVAYTSYATNLVPGDTNGTWDIFLWDRETSTTERVSLSDDSIQANGASYRPSVSADGSYVSFDSLASNLVDGDTNGQSDVFVWDRTTHTMERISVATNGAEGDDRSFASSISGDGGVVAYESDATNLVQGDTNEANDVFVSDRRTGTTRRVSISSQGDQADGFSRDPQISGDGRHVVYRSSAPNLAPGNSVDVDVYMSNLRSNTTRRISMGLKRAPADWASFEPSVSWNGGVVAFGSAASNLVRGDTNVDHDIFIWHR